jgi:hypothetical protein
MSESAGLLNSVVGHGGGTPAYSNAIKERQPMSIYRRLYEQAYGPIPPGYHIHHKDGDHSNNDPSNLVAVTAKEHYDIHYSQGDYGACWAMYRTGHMTLSPEERSLLVSKQQQDLIKENKHPFQKREDGTSVSSDIVERRTEIVKQTQQDLVKTGKHHLLSENRDTAMDRKKSETMKERYKDPAYKEYRRQCSLGRTWKRKK